MVGMSENNWLEFSKLEKRSRLLLANVVFLSFLVNLLMLSGPLFMLQIYDRVLISRSYETLSALIIIVVFLFLIMGILDHYRSRIMARIGANFQISLEDKAFLNSIRKDKALSPESNLIVDLENVKRFLISPSFFSFLDLPWAPFFMTVIFIFHPLLGALGLVGAGVLVLTTYFSQLLTSNQVRDAEVNSRGSTLFGDKIFEKSEVVKSLGMQEAMLKRWKLLRSQALVDVLTVSDRIGLFSTFSRTFRQFLQYAVFGLGAYLVLENQITAGAMIATSIVLARALAPIEQVITHWPLFTGAKNSWHTIKSARKNQPDESQLQVELPKPKSILELQAVSGGAEGDKKPNFFNISFKLVGGQSLGVIGRSGSGKSSLARAIVGVWPLLSGRILLGGAPIEQYRNTSLGQFYGYLPQSVVFFEGSVAENISRMKSGVVMDLVIDAARKANAHELILSLKHGYNTLLDSNGEGLSGGQLQRIGLARAFFGDPVVLVLDEPNANLDEEGIRAFNKAVNDIKQSGKVVVIMAHRPSAIETCDLLLVMDKGRRIAFGERQDVLRAHTKNHQSLGNR